MLYRVAIVLVGGGYIAYRVALAIQILRAKRAGDTVRERQLRSRGFGLYRWAAGTLVVVVVLLVLLVWSNR
jgi:hypothetical protein